MDGMVSRFGTVAGLLFEVHWADKLASASATEATRGRLSLLIDGEVIWHGEDVSDGFSWTWIELLDFLSLSWANLKWEEGFPFGLRPSSPANLRAQVDNRWENLPAKLREEEEDEFERFQEYHDLARSVQGALIPSVWIVREGLGCWISGGTRSIYRPVDDVLQALHAVAEEIAGRVENHLDDRARIVLADWSRRDAVATNDFIKIATGLDEGEILAVAASGTLNEVWEVESDALELNELLAAARMASGLPPSDLAYVVRTVREVPRVETPQLDALAKAASTVLLEVESERPYDQGYALAEWLRVQPGVTSREGRVEPRELLSSWGVHLRTLPSLISEVDAVACWGHRHGPAVLLNPDGSHNSSPGGRRATYAHEIAHLLVDRAGALPLAEVLGGRASPIVEARARAFAAELLLPREVAGRVMAEAGEDPQLALFELQDAYGVSQELVAWQTRNSGVFIPPDVTAFLRGRVSRPGLY